MSTNISTKRVYDVPTRLFHWLFAAFFIIAFTISNTVDDDEILFSYHMIAGLIMCSLILWRIVWGVMGSRYARFSDFQLRPTALIHYAKSIFSGGLSSKTRLWSGHNPASSWAAVSMMLLGLGLGLSGFLMATGESGELLEDTHELLADAFIIVVLLHIAGIVIHTMKHKDAIGKSMITGCKQHTPDSDASVPRHVLGGVLLLVLVLSFSAYLLNNFDTSTRNLSIFGTQLQLAEFEGDESNEHEYEREHEHEHEQNNEHKDD